MCVCVCVCVRAKIMLKDIWMIYFIIIIDFFTNHVLLLETFMMISTMNAYKSGTNRDFASLHKTLHYP